MRRRSREVSNSSWPSWRYGPFGEAEVFQCESDVPPGWTRKPGEIYTPPENLSLDQDELVKQLEALSIEINPTWGKAHMKRILDDISTTR